jgi:hypothetical protein
VIEDYRQRTGLRDRDTALGPEPKDRAARREREQAQGLMRRSQLQLGIERAQRIERAARAMEIEL